MYIYNNILLDNNGGMRLQVDCKKQITGNSSDSNSTTCNSAPLTKWIIKSNLIYQRTSNNKIIYSDNGDGELFDSDDYADITTTGTQPSSTAINNMLTNWRSKIRDSSDSDKYADPLLTGPTGLALAVSSPARGIAYQGSGLVITRDFNYEARPCTSLGCGTKNDAGARQYVTGGI